jgi:predicted peptidase
VEYALYVPPWDTGAPRQCIVYLHGSDSVKHVTREGLAATIRQRLRKGEDFQFAVFLPVCPPGARAGELRAASLLDTLNYLIERHRLDANRLYLMGHHGGASALWPLATYYPGHWAAIVAVDPVSVPGVDEMPRVPCWIFHGKQKKDRPETEIEAFGRELARRGGDVLSTDYAKESEVYSNPKVFTWLARQRRS